MWKPFLFICLCFSCQQLWRQQCCVVYNVIHHCYHYFINNWPEKYFRNKNDRFVLRVAGASVSILCFCLFAACYFLVFLKAFSVLLSMWGLCFDGKSQLGWCLGQTVPVRDHGLCQSWKETETDLLGKGKSQPTDILILLL